MRAVIAIIVFLGCQSITAQAVPTDSVYIRSGDQWYKYSRSYYEKYLQQPLQQPVSYPVPESTPQQGIGQWISIFGSLLANGLAREYDPMDATRASRLLLKQYERALKSHRKGKILAQDYHNYKKKLNAIELTPKQ